MSLPASYQRFLLGGNFLIFDKCPLSKEESEKVEGDSWERSLSKIEEYLFNHRSPGSFASAIYESYNSQEDKPFNFGRSVKDKAYTTNYCLMNWRPPKLPRKIDTDLMFRVIKDFFVKEVNLLSREQKARLQERVWKLNNPISPDPDWGERNLLVDLSVFFQAFIAHDLGDFALREASAENFCSKIKESLDSEDLHIDGSELYVIKNSWQRFYENNVPFHIEVDQEVFYCLRAVRIDHPERPAIQVSQAEYFSERIFCANTLDVMFRADLSQENNESLNEKLRAIDNEIFPHRNEALFSNAVKKKYWELNGSIEGELDWGKNHLADPNFSFNLMPAIKTCLGDEVSNLNDAARNEFFGNLYKLINPQTDDPQWAEHHLFDHLGFFALAFVPYDCEASMRKKARSYSESVFNLLSSEEHHLDQKIFQLMIKIEGNWRDMPEGELRLKTSASFEEERTWKIVTKSHQLNYSNASPHNTRVLQDVEKELEAENPELRESLFAKMNELDLTGANQEECVVCKVETRTYAVLPCGHYNYCGPCIDRLTQCALCRLEIQSKHRIIS